MSALDTMKSALQCSKTEAAKLRIRVRQLEEKLIEVAAIGERELEAVRQGADVLIAENAGLVAANKLLAKDRDYFKASYSRKLDDEKLALETASAALAENTRQAVELKEAKDEALLLQEQMLADHGRAARAEALNTPLRARVAALEQQLSETRGSLESLRPLWRDEVGTPTWMAAHAGAHAVFAPESPSGTEPAVTGTTSDNPSIRKPAGAWLIWSFEHDAWWAPDGRGYTPDINLAGRYSQARAEEIVRNANLGSDRRNEAMLHAPEADMNGPHGPNPADVDAPRGAK